MRIAAAAAAAAAAVDTPYQCARSLWCSARIVIVRGPASACGPFYLSLVRRLFPPLCPLRRASSHLFTAALFILLGACVCD